MSQLWPRGLGRHLVAHPGDLVAIVSAAWALRRRAWWRTSPYLPVPDPDYWRFRLTTAFGSSDAVPNVEDVVAAARWSRRQRHRR